MLLPWVDSIWDMAIQKFGSPRYEDIQTRIPLYFIIDKDYKYEESLEVLAIDK